ncbi:DUF3221 domain-containing protein [Halobacillus litoralis]|uniref:DUF3221 domain-containing protein n=1 Tax=Halobacillus litoralis TaxID=45668 RepID=A0A845F6W6_9BACI|nr:DUF3221 domain-containing protein [Halobacillus litoralis]MYL69455.1 DUF3221 domain-containing protein [Halobacillus litoralis]
MMKMRWMLGMFMVLSLCLSGCGLSETEEVDQKEVEAEVPDPDISGFVMDQDEDSILVVTPMDDGSGEEGRAMWVAGAPKGLWVGKQVEVWVDGDIAESYPEQATAEKVQELEMSEVEGADLKASEALSTALSEKEPEKSDVLIVSLLSFDKESDQWTVELDRRGTNQGEWKTTVKDKK